ncbi:MAG: hypothetical protein M1831_000990 [Alyxoria varia]|nr:MAG: hypothetical protein M1831_000990 [Alyxoria varia]
MASTSINKRCNKCEQHRHPSLFKSFNDTRKDTRWCVLCNTRNNLAGLLRMRKAGTPIARMKDGVLARVARTCDMLIERERVMSEELKAVVLEHIAKLPHWGYTPPPNSTVESIRDQRKARKAQRHEEKSASTASAFPQRTLAPPAQAATAPPAPSTSSQNYRPWTSHGKEDQITAHTIAHGYVAPQRVPHETRSARETLWPHLKQPAAQTKLSEILTTASRARGGGDTSVGMDQEKGEDAPAAKRWKKQNGEEEIMEETEDEDVEKGAD